MRFHGLWVAAALALQGSRAEAEIRTDGLDGRTLGAWNAIVSVVRAVGPDGQPVHPRLHRLYRELSASPHVIHILMPATSGSSAIAGRFWIEEQGPSGVHRASITLNLRAIDRIDADPARARAVSFHRLDRTKRYAQVLGHELAHAVWAFSDEANLRLAAQAQRRSLELGRLARTGFAGRAGFSEAVAENERSLLRLEQPALEAETAVAQELRASLLLSRAPARRRDR